MGIEVDFISQTECSIPEVIFSKIDFTVGAIHWLQDLPVETQPQRCTTSFDSREHQINDSIPLQEGVWNPQIELP